MAGKRRPTKKKNQAAFSPVFAGIVISLLLLAGWGFWNQFQKLDEIGRYKACLEIENDPSLTFPCTCRPKALNASEGEDFVYDRTSPLCICECKISSNVTQTFEIRKAKASAAQQPTIPAGYLD